MRGSVRKKDNAWQYTVDIGKDPSTGKRRRKSKGGFRTKKDCEKAMSELITQIQNGNYFEESGLLFKDYLKKWLNSYQSNVSPRTYIRYENDINKYISIHLGNIEISNLKPLHIQDFYNHCLKKLNLSPTTVIHFHAIIHKSLSQAVKWQLINFNPADSVEKPKKIRKEMVVWTQEEVNEVLKRTKDMTIYIPILLAVGTGMRRGEILGLTWDNVDFDDSVIYVQKQLQKINDQLILMQPKTKRSIRKITISTNIISVLKELKKEQFKNRLYLGENYNKNSFVVCQNDGRPYDPGYITKNFGRILKRICPELNIPIISFHDLRHTHATLLLKAGVNPKVVAERLGHTTVSMTLDTYSHVLPDMQKEVAEKIDKILSI